MSAAADRPDAVRAARTEEAGALDRLVELATPGRAAAAANLRRRFSAPRLRVLVAGEAKRGKSTLVNRLLGADLLPTGAVPVTAVVTTVLPAVSGSAALEVDFLDGRTEERGVQDLPDLVTEARNPGNRAAVREVRARVPAAGLGDRVELVDTPGTGSVWQHNTDAAAAAFATLDAVVVVLVADPPVSAADRDLLVTLGAASLHTFVFVNKLDQVLEADRAEVEAFTRRVCLEAGARQVWFGSAREVDVGLEAFRAAFQRYVDERAGADTARALARHARRLLDSLVGDVALELGVLDASQQEDSGHVHDFAVRLGILRARAGRLDTECTAVEVGLRQDLDHSAAALRDQTLGEGMQALTATQNETQGRGVVEEVTTAAVLDWRAQQHQLMEARLAELRGSVAIGVAAQLAQMTQDAVDLLGVRLDTEAPDFVLALGPTTPLDYQPGPRWEGPVAGLLRERAPGASSRARARLLAEVPGLVDRQVGRARSDLQRELQAAIRDLRRQLVVEHSERLDELSEVLAKAHREVARDADRASARRAWLAERHRRLQAVAHELSAPDISRATPGSHDAWRRSVQGEEGLR